MTNQTEAPVSATTKITVNGFSFLLTVRSGAVAAALERSIVDQAFVMFCGTAAIRES